LLKADSQTSRLKFQVLTAGKIVFLIINLRIKLWRKRILPTLDSRILQINTKLINRQEIAENKDFQTLRRGKIIAFPSFIKRLLKIARFSARDYSIQAEIV
jgi:hypothetical protein